jgi:hypothetical protein
MNRKTPVDLNYAVCTYAKLHMASFQKQEGRTTHVYAVEHADALGNAAVFVGYPRFLNPISDSYETILHYQRKNI